MAAIPILTPLDLNQNELLKAVLQNLATAPTTPTPIKGQLYFNTTDNKPYYFDGTNWVDFYGGIEEIVLGSGTALSFPQGTGTDTQVYLKVNTDGVTLEINASNELGVKDNGISYAKLQQVGNLKLLGNESGATANVYEIPICIDLGTGNDLDIPTVKAVTDAISSSVTAVGTFVDGWDASSGAYPTVGSNGDIVKGDYWVISVAGTLGTALVVNIGDVLYARIDNPSGTTASPIVDDANWFVAESNRGQATETTLGVIKIATQALVDAGADDLTAVTPKKLATLISNIGGGFNSHKKIFNIVGDGTTSTFSLVHNLGTTLANVTIKQSASPYSRIMVDIQYVDSNTVYVAFSKAVPAGVDYNAVIIG